MWIYSPLKLFYLWFQPNCGHTLSPNWLICDFHQNFYNMNLNKPLMTGNECFMIQPPPPLITRTLFKYHVSAELKEKQKCTAVWSWHDSGGVRLGRRMAQLRTQKEGQKATADRPLNPATWPYAVMFLMQGCCHSHSIQMSDIHPVSHSTRNVILFHRPSTLLLHVLIYSY
jgi:hypothetical protein